MEKELLHKYFRGDTSPEEETRIMDWAERSPENYSVYLHERMIWNATLIHYEAPAGRSSSTAHARRRRLDVWKINCIAAIFLLLLTLSYTIISGSFQDTGEDTQTIWVPAGQRARLSLADGTTVWLNSNSTFSYPTRFNQDSREVRLDGEGFFEVARNEDKPFIVRTSRYDIRVLGTVFNVYAYASDKSSFEVSLLHGAVSVSSPGSGESVRLSPNERISEIDGNLRKLAIDNLDRFRWKDGLICLDDVPFD